MPDPVTVSTSNPTQVVSKDPDDDVAELFDKRPEGPIEGALYGEPSLLSKVWTSVRGFFVGLSDGISSAWSKILSAFSSKEQVNQAVRHIRKETTAIRPEPGAQAMQSAVGSTTIHSSQQTVKAERLPSASSLQEVVSDAVTDGAISLIRPVSTEVTEGVDTATEAPVNHEEAKAFSLFVSDFKQAQKEERAFSTVGRQQFDDAAKRHAQKVYDAEVASIGALGEQLADYALGTDKALEIQVASSLLDKPLPHQPLLDLTGQSSVPTYSAQDKECFDAWVEWRTTKALPGGKAIDLEKAARYADEFIRKNVSNAELARSTEIKTKLEQAFKLISDRDSDQVAMDAQETNALMDEHRAAFSGVSLPAFPKKVDSMDLLMIGGGLHGATLRSMISATRRYFSAIRKGKEPDVEKKAQAITLASLWMEGKSSPKIRDQMMQLDFFGSLDQLLDVEKIKNDFK